jgi:hypothetical protein
VHPGLDVGLKAQEADAVFEAQIGGKPAEFALERSGARDEQLGGLRDAGKGAQQRGIVFDGLQTARGEPKELMVEAKVAAYSGTRLRVGAEVFDIDSVGDNGELIGRHHAGFEMSFGD